MSLCRRASDVRSSNGATIVVRSVGRRVPKVVHRRQSWSCYLQVCNGMASSDVTRAHAATTNNLHRLRNVSVCTSTHSIVSLKANTVRLLGKPAVVKVDNHYSFQGIVCQMNGAKQ
jgi:hypothetical protein